MALAFDAATESIRTGVEDPYTFTHTPVGTPRGIAVSIVYNSGSELISGVTYGGQTLFLQKQYSLPLGSVDAMLY